MSAVVFLFFATAVSVGVLLDVVLDAFQDVARRLDAIQKDSKK